MYTTAMQKRDLLREAFLTGEAATPPTSVFVGPGYVQHASREWHEEQYLQYHSYLISKSRELPDAVTFIYGDSSVLSQKMLQSLYKEICSSRKRY